MKESSLKINSQLLPITSVRKVLEPQRRFGTLGLKKSSTVKVSLS